MFTLGHAANRARRSVFSRSSPDFHSEVISAITAYRKSSTTMTAYFTIGRSLHGNQNDRDDFQNLIAMSETTNGLIEIDISDILRLIPSLQSQLSPIL